MIFFSYRHAITGDSVLEPPVGPFGGILADTMGLGKTVTTLSTIVSTLNHAKEWTEKQTNDGSEKRRAKATLIVLPNEGKVKNHVTILKLILTLNLKC